MSTVGPGRTRRIGILGGMGPMATQAFYRELILQTDASSDQDHLEVVIVASPKVPDRTAFLLGRGPDPMPSLLEAAQRLAASGAELIVMPCNSAQGFTDRLEQAVGIPFVPWVDTAVEAIAASAPVPVALLATAGTLDAGIYTPALERSRLRHILPDAAETDELMVCIYAFKAGAGATHANETRLLSVAETMHARGARSFILGCTELPLIVPSDSPRWPGPAIDPAVHVARRAIREAGGSLVSA